METPIKELESELKKHAQQIETEVTDEITMVELEDIPRSNWGGNDQEIRNSRKTMAFGLFK